MLSPRIEFLDERDAVPRPPVKKQIWNGTEFVPVYLYRSDGKLKDEECQWLEKTYGAPGKFVDGCYWDRLHGMFIVMDEKVYMFYKLKWAEK